MRHGRHFYPLILLLALQSCVGLLTLLRPVMGHTIPTPFVDWGAPLIGVRNPAPDTSLSIRTVADGAFQRGAQAWIADHVVQRAAIVRGFNQALWDVFRTSYMENRSLIRGKDGVLFEQSYILAYCGMALATDVRAMPEFGRRLRTVEDWFARRGKILVYYLAPTKTSWFPDSIPDAYPCSPERGGNAVRSAVLSAFHEAGVDYVDGPLALQDRRGRPPIDLFPRNGIHWNWLGSAIGTQALLTKLHDLGATGLPELTYDVDMTPDEVGTDRDLESLLNLMWPTSPIPAPALAVKAPAPPGKLRLAAVNDSFFAYLPMVLLQSGHVFTSATAFGYMTLDQRRYENDGMSPITADPGEIKQTLLAADVVVLEEVESRVGGPYARQFLDMMETEMARNPAPPR
jgi:hypothetical protein